MTTRTPAQIRTHAQKFFIKIEEKIGVKDTLNYINSKSPKDFVKIKQMHINCHVNKPDNIKVKEVERVEIDEIDKKVITGKDEETKQKSAFSAVSKLNLIRPNVDTSDMLFRTTLNLNSLNGKILSQYLLMHHEVYERQQDELLAHFSNYASKLANISNNLFSIMMTSKVEG